ncbi:hypothetical protein CBL_02891 [Carabus blaptoides fortunei]
MGVRQSVKTTSRFSGLAAFQHVRDNIDGLNGTAGIQDTDLIFLKALMDSPVMRGLVKVCTCNTYITGIHHGIVSIT